MFDYRLKTAERRTIVLYVLKGRDRYHLVSVASSESVVLVPVNGKDKS